ncbi:MAG: hypothetical protein K0R02_1233 [Rickettsiaceae bacterium]|jgi:hypothetical protein|nr:hypothetical protein [Rickettsiaceae bacterium]
MENILPEKLRILRNPNGKSNDELIDAAETALIKLGYSEEIAKATAKKLVLESQ